MDYLALPHKIIVINFFILASFVFFSNSASALTCAVRAGACNAGETALLRMQATDNSHAGFMIGSSYSNLICCSEAGVTIGTTCGGNYDTFLKLSAADNAHVEKKTFFNYASNACISVNTGSISCSYSAGACLAGMACLAKISADTNAHIGSCAGSGYTNSVCCGYCGPPTPCTSPPNACGQTNSGTLDCAGNCTAITPPDSNCPSCTINSAPNPINIGDSSLLSWTTTNAISASIDNGIGVVSIPTGTQSVSPILNTTYTMTANGSSGTPGTCSATVSFFAPTCALSSSETTVWKGDTVDLSWTTTNAISATINGINAVPVASGSMTSPPINAPTAFTMTATGPGGTGSCGPVNIGLYAPPLGGLVPCGRLGDDPATPEINETQPCDLCAAFYMLKKTLNFAMEIAVGIAIFIIIIGGLLYAFSAGNPGNMEKAKSAISYALAGLSLIFVAWVIAAIVLQVMGYGNMATWNQVNCSLQT